MAKEQVTRSTYETLRSQLKTDRSTLDSRWKDISRFVHPESSQFDSTETGQNIRKDEDIINSTATHASRTLRAGMMGGITSPARNWKRLTTADSQLAELSDVKAWLHEVDQGLSTVFLRSNLYNSLPQVYGDIGDYGTSAMLVEEDFDTVIRTYVFPVGSYSIANDEKGRVRTFSREFRMKVRQLITRFATDAEGNIDWTKLSTHVKSLYDDNHLETWIDVHHVIHANIDYDPKALLSNKKKYRSVYYEFGSSDKNAPTYNTVDDKQLLRDKGYDYFPVLVPRWSVRGEDEYGVACPGMEAIGDVKSLQTMEKDKAEALKKKVKPPMTAPTSLKTSRASILAGDITYIDERDGAKSFRPVYEVNFQIGELKEDINEHEMRIERAYFADLFLMLASLDRANITATEVMERKEEKMLALGPVLEQLNQDLLDPLIDITFNIMLQQGLIPPAPESLQSSPLKVEYISIMHQAQKSAGLAGIERLAGFVTELSAVYPNVVDKLDADQLVDEYGEITGVPPRIVRSDDEVAVIREATAEAAQKQQQMEMMAQGAGVAKDLSSAEVGGGNALEALVQQSEAGALV